MCRREEKNKEIMRPVSARSLWAVAASLVVRNRRKNEDGRRDLLFFHVVPCLCVERRVLLTLL